MCGASAGWCGHHVSSWHHSCAFCSAVFSLSPGKVWNVSQIQSHGWRGGNAGEGGGGGSGGGGLGTGSAGNGGGWNTSGGEGEGGGGAGGGLGAVVHSHTSFRAPVAGSVTVVSVRVRPVQHGSVSQSAPSPTHGVMFGGGGGGGGCTPSGGGGEGGLGGGAGGCGERTLYTCGGEGGGPGAGGGDGLRVLAGPPANVSPARSPTSPRGMSTHTKSAPRPSRSSGSSLRQPLPLQHQTAKMESLVERFLLG